MPSAYAQLLDAVILHLQNMKTRGAQLVSVSPETLAGLKNLAETRRKPTHPSAPAAPILNQGSSSHVPLPSVGVPIPKKAAIVEKGHDSLMDVFPEKKVLPSVPALDPAAKAAAFADLCQRAMTCIKCQHLAASRTNVVFGVGNINAELMFIGEAPGADEDSQGEPFVGRAGQLLTKIIETMGLSRGTVYIANILKCRPDTPGQPSGNRKPTVEEMQTCIPFLHEQIDLIQPKVIVALGGTAVEGLLGKTAGITRLRGTWQTYRNIPLMPTYHPAYLLRNQGPIEKRRVWEDMLQVMEKLGLQISDKQRNFFSKGT